MYMSIIHVASTDVHAPRSYIHNAKRYLHQLCRQVCVSAKERESFLLKARVIHITTRKAALSLSVLVQPIFIQRMFLLLIVSRSILEKYTGAHNTHTDTKKEREGESYNEKKLLGCFRIFRV